jgi:UDP-glucose 6-dehydrogenase
MKVACIGAGYVGGPTMAVMALKCPDSTFTVVDLNQERIDAWNAEDTDNLPIYEPGLAAVIAEARGRNLFFTTRDEEAIVDADIIFVSVNTPTKTTGVGAGRAADMTNYELAARRIADLCANAPACAGRVKIIVEKSTIPVRTAASLKRVLLESPAAQAQACRFVVLSNPEFLAEGTAVRDLLAPDRVLIGGGDDDDDDMRRRRRARDYAQASSAKKQGGPGGDKASVEKGECAADAAGQGTVDGDKKKVGGEAGGDGGDADADADDDVDVDDDPSAAAIATLAALYGRWVPADRIITTSLWSGELAKLVANAFLAQRVSSINAVSAVCEATGADVGEVARAVGSDSRIGSKFLKLGGAIFFSFLGFFFFFFFFRFHQFFFFFFCACWLALLLLTWSLINTRSHTHSLSLSLSHTHTNSNPNIQQIYL